MKRFILSFLVVACTACYCTVALAWSGTVTKIHDGDTITVQPVSEGKPVKIRLWGIDCPEYKQSYGKEATEFVRRLLPLGALVDIEDVDKDRFGRVVAIVYVEEKPVQEFLLRQGLAWVYSKFYKERGRDWPELQKNAQLSRVGLWKEKSPMPPWEWRKAKRKAK